MKENVAFLALLSLFALLPGSVEAQTISPVIAEYQGSGSGSFQIINDTLQPFTVVLKPMSFSVDPNGQPLYRALDPEVSIEFSAKSFRVPPHRQYSVYYRTKSARTPTWFTIYASVVSNTKANGMSVVIDLPHTVYLLSKQSLSASDVVFRSAGLSSKSRKISAVVENTSGTFERVGEVEVSSAAGKQVYAGFPFFPGQRRVLNLDWNREDAPRQIELKFKKFKVEQSLAVGASPP
jgi:hypothetical protein